MNDKTRQLEKTVLGAALTTHAHALEVVGRLQALDFYDPLHRSVFSAIRALAVKGEPVELPSVRDAMKPFGVGDEDRLFTLPDEWMFGRNLQHYIDRLKEASHLRRLHDACRHALALTEERELGYEERLEQVGEAVFSALEDRIRDSFVSISQLEGEFGELLQDAKSVPAPGKAAIPTGLPTLDEAIGGGLRPGTLNILGARTGYGKTTLATDLFHSATEKQVPALYVSLESRRLEILLSLVQKRSGVSAAAIVRGMLPDLSYQNALRAFGELKVLPLHFEDGASGLPHLIVSIRRAAALHGVRLVVVDYLQMIENPNGGKDRYVQVAGITRALKRLAADLGIAIYALAQLNRQPENRPGGEIRLSDLREADSIAHDADLVLFLHRPGMNGKKGKRDALQVAKNRLPGGRPLDRLELAYRLDKNSYEEA